MANFPKFLPNIFDPGKPPQITQPGDSMSQPTGATTTGTGVKADQAIPEMQRVETRNIPSANPPPVAQPTNTWAQHDSNLRGSHIDPWVKQYATDSLAPPTLGNEAAIAATLANLANFDAVMQRVRMKLTPKPWSVVTSGGMGIGLSPGTSGAGSLYPVRCLLEGVHNPSSTSVTFGLSDLGSGDPTPKFSCTVGAGATVSVGGNGLLFPHGISIITMTAGGVLTFFGSDSLE